jgi:ATP-binding cassette subfamily F protein uup
VVVSHDRYFVERVCDDVYALSGAGGIRHLPAGIDQYVEDRRGLAEPPPPPPAKRERGAAGVARDTRKEIMRLERQIEKLTAREAELLAEMAAHATDFGRLRALQEELEGAAAERERLEDAWLELSEST